MRGRLRPTAVNLGRITAHADAIHRGIRRQSAHHHRKFILAPAAIDDVGEQECLALILFDTTNVLPTHQRMHFSILVDGTIDGQQQAGFAQRVKMVVQVGVVASVVGHEFKDLLTTD